MLTGAAYQRDPIPDHPYKITLGVGGVRLMRGERKIAAGDGDMATDWKIANGIYRFTACEWRQDRGNWRVWDGARSGLSPEVYAITGASLPLSEALSAAQAADYLRALDEDPDTAAPAPVPHIITGSYLYRFDSGPGEPVLRTVRQGWRLEEARIAYAKVPKRVRDRYEAGLKG